MNILLENFGTRLKELRKSKQISQKELSESTGIVREQISRIENGLVNPTLDTLHKISLALNIFLHELLNFEINSKENSKLAKFTFPLKPFVKWAGGKTQLLNVLEKEIPKNFNTYFEPFVGGGALFLKLQPLHAVISDSNIDLISTYKSFQSKKNYKKMVHELLKHQNNHNENYYYKIRNLDKELNFDKELKYIKAARMIYLNKSCFNGLYRVNSKGFFNVPSGKYKRVNAYDEFLYKNLNEYFLKSKVKILNQDYKKVISLAKAGDFVYLDPPYDTLDEKKNFTTYTKNAFGKNEQKHLAETFKDLDKRGVKVMLSNHNTHFINELYKDYNIKVIHARRSINSSSSGRGKIEEVLITNYKN
ncbi:Dam family site-specific DNA-(adenine-N6)-methyltransferase [[Mycoplasma] mobile]|uniref:Site-specific DNA-methyltransferase (adenine-specific) n=1 Tax=Mycoplasma mobile (strain ATCC 43663 / 163K / NCTC 11711) TaxID=267748 RepID=Q6KHU7_MYCM1|nr:Dam family site-specific DNA-(adenine-N6)-methyltransferase [[Mycoplasma] mobile]AAT27831.1 adenine-specific DNA methyltransferase [Mycoplasma mobile 163K]